MPTPPSGLMLSQQIDFFFAAPLPLQAGSSVSTLHLNRREAQDCLLGDVIPEDRVTADPRSHRLFATVMVIAAGIDLLAKFYDGSDANGGVRDRVVDFAERFVFTGMPSARTYGEVFYYGCRNPMLHSFHVTNDRFRIGLTNQLASGPIWKATAPDGSAGYVVSVRGLFAAYVAAIGRYEAALRADTALQANFGAMFEPYGFIGVWSAVAEPVRR